MAEPRRVDNEDELVAHYKQRLRDLLPFATHKPDCIYVKWTIGQYFQKHYGTGYSLGPQPNCSCGAAALIAIIQVEVYDENGKPV